MNEILRESGSVPYRVHSSKKPIIINHKMRYLQQYGRKPNGFWWSDTNSWDDFIITKKPKGKQLENYRYHVHIDRRCHLIQLIDWASILNFTVRYGITLASQGQFFWQNGDQTKYDPAQDEFLSKNNCCRVSAIDWQRVAQNYDGIEIPTYSKHDDRPYVEWLDIDWDVPSGCAWNLNGVSVTLIT